MRRESIESFTEQKFRVFTEMRLNKLKHQFIKNISSNNAYFRTKLLWEIKDEYIEVLHIYRNRIQMGTPGIEGFTDTFEKTGGMILGTQHTDDFFFHLNYACL